MTGDEIRTKFTDYFVERGHTLVKSDILVPQNDPTLLFTNAGMVQFKNVFLGKETRDYKRAVSVQKCVRAGGKHNDLEMVGRTARHHTFFEMLGNFSFGDYFKKEAIEFGWEFLTDVLQLPKEKLYVSVFETDDEAFDYWANDIGVPKERISRLGEEENFWSMGPTGPCGPCSEIHIDQGEILGCGKPDCAVGCECDRYLEIWNLVFMQYDRDAEGILSPLPNPCIDTGMGLERLTAVVQKQPSNYDSDLLSKIIEDAAKIAEISYGSDKSKDVSLKVIADHSRAAAFLINDGILPSNEGRGYVLRRIIRRALRHGKMLNIEFPFLHQITDKIVSYFKGAYPELEENRVFINRVAQNEEESFKNTLHYGTQRLDEILEKVKKSGESVVPGEEVFKLYDTYGFPVDLAQDIAQDANYTLDLDGFNKAMQNQKEMAMASWKGSGEKEISPFFKDYLQSSPPTEFEGYNQTQSESLATAILKNDKEIDSASVGEEITFLTKSTPFYGESGGQVGDFGKASSENALLEITSATKPVPELIAHHAKIISGSIKKGDKISLQVDQTSRQNTALNHTSTHLLHAALKTVLGDHVKQAGSLVSPDRLRFDYSHFSPLTEKERSRIETLVNEEIRKNTAVQTIEMSIQEALDDGATALFGEKYGSSVRVVSVPGFSKELCGGTHISATGDVGIFKIISEGSVASGVRRIEAITGSSALQKIQEDTESLGEIRNILKSQPKEELGRIQKLIEKNRELEKQIQSLKEKMLFGSGQDKGEEFIEINGIKTLVKNLESMDSKTMRTYIDNAKNKMKSGVVVVGSVQDGKVLLAAGVTKDLTKQYHAGNLLKEIAQIVGGSGGGRPDMAQAGGSQPENLDKALEEVSKLIQNN
jgi:alanyl-tRNA synthetase